MDDSDHALRKRLLAIFEEEAREHIAALSRLILQLEKAPARDAPASLESAFRAAHSLKGASRAVNQGGVESVCDALENLFSKLKRGRFTGSPGTFDTLLEAVAILEVMLDGLHDGESPPPARLHAILDALARASVGAATPPAAVMASDTTSRAQETAEAGVAGPVSPGRPRSPSDETVRISTAKLEAIRRQTEDLLSQRLAADRQCVALKETCNALRDRRRAGGGDGASLDEIHERLRQIQEVARRHRQALFSKTDRLLEDARNLLMVPCSTLAEGMPRLVRSLAQELGKEVDFAMVGGDLEIDRHIVNELRDPFIHMVRNALDHGLETPPERESAGKRRCGRLTITVRRTPGDRVALAIEDDGRGIDVEQLRSTLVEDDAASSMADADAAGDEALMLDQIFRSSFTTSPHVSDISGRGLGLAIVREKAEKLGGSVAVENRPGQGVRFQVTVPLSLATLRGVVVRVGRSRFIVPTADVKRVMRVKADALHTVGNRPVLKIGSETVAVARMERVLQLGAGGDSEDGGGRFGMLIAHQGHRILFLVDAVEEEREVLVKGLGAPVSELTGVIGATVLASGAVAPILDAGAIVDAAIRTENREEGRVPSKAETVSSQPASILLVEDSITSRTLLKSILAAAGYRVTTAVDGLDAFRRLQQDPFDLVVSDIDMPRLDGISLTARIRADGELNALPVILVTSLDSPEDRERGAEAGADAYLVKRDFEQSNLLEAVKRFL